MLNYILNAYEETRRQNEEDFFKVLKHVGIENKICSIIFLICYVAMIHRDNVRLGDTSQIYIGNYANCIFGLDCIG